MKLTKVVLVPVEEIKKLKEVYSLFCRYDCYPFSGQERPRGFKKASQDVKWVAYNTWVERTIVTRSKY